jgi:hypothetical protein
MELVFAADGRQGAHMTTGVKDLSIWRRLFPLAIMLAYLVLTVLLFRFSPWEYPIVDGSALWTFLALAHLALAAGYLSAAFQRPRAYDNRWAPSAVLLLSLGVSLVLLYPTAVFRTRGTMDVAGALDDPGQAYVESVSALKAAEGGALVVEYARILVGPALVLLLPLTIFYWKRLGVSIRITAVAAHVCLVLISIAMGTNKLFADTALLVPLMLVAGHLSGVSRLRRRAIAAMATASVVALVAFGAYFAKTQGMRSGSSASSGYFEATGVRANYDHVLLRGLPPDAQVGVLGLDSYVTQGYYALYLSLDEPFVPMWGIGNSLFLQRQVARISGDRTIEAMSYPARIEYKGWDSYLLWSSIYPWIASDVSFPGTLIVVFFIGRLFARSWLDTLEGSNPFAVGLFAQMLIMLFYFPANNQLLQSGEGFTAFWGTLGLWWLTRVKPSGGALGGMAGHE